MRRAINEPMMEKKVRILIREFKKIGFVKQDGQILQRSRSNFSGKRVRRRQFILQEGEVCRLKMVNDNRLYFVVDLGNLSHYRRNLTINIIEFTEQFYL